MPTRTEHDLLGDRDVPASAYYGVHTVRAVENFPISGTPISAYPDLVVVCGERQFHDEHRDVLLNPTLIVEVLSPSTEDNDRAGKFERYRTWLPSFTEYVVVHQSQPRIEHHLRQSEEQWLLTTIDGLHATVGLSSIGCELKLSDVYEGVRFASETDPPES